MGADGLTVADGARTPSPTDIGQFIRPDLCERYPRLRLDDRPGRDRWGELDVAPGRIPSLLTRAGARFEARVERDVRANTPRPVRNLAPGERPCPPPLR